MGAKDVTIKPETIHAQATFTWDDLLAGESKAERDGAISDGRTTRQSPERTNMLLVFMQMGVAVDFDETDELLKLDSTLELAQHLQMFHLTLAGRDEYPFKDMAPESIERALNRNIQAGLIVKHSVEDLYPVEDVDGIGDLDWEPSMYRPGFHHIEDRGMGYLIAHDIYDCYEELRRYVLTGITEDLPGVPNVGWDVEGMYGTQWLMSEKVFNDLNTGARPHDHDLIGDADKIGDLAVAVAEMDWQYVWTQIERKDAFVRSALSRLDYSSKMMEMSLKVIDPTRKGGQRAAPKIRDELAEHWEEHFDNDINKAKIYVEEMILRQGYMTLRATLDQQTGLASRAKQFKRPDLAGEYASSEVSQPRLTAWIADFANTAWREIARREDALLASMNRWQEESGGTSEEFEKLVKDAIPIRRVTQDAVNRFNSAAEIFENITEQMQVAGQDASDFWDMFDMNVQLLHGGVHLTEDFPYRVQPVEPSLLAEWEEHGRKALGLG